MVQGASMNPLTVGSWFSFAEMRPALQILWNEVVAKPKVIVAGIVLIGIISR